MTKVTNDMEALKGGGFYEKRKYVSDNVLIPKQIPFSVSIFNLYKMSIYFLHTGTLSYLVEHILTALRLLSCFTIDVIVNIFLKGLLFNETHFIYFFTTHFQNIFLHFCRPIMD